MYDFFLCRQTHISLVYHHSNAFLFAAVGVPPCLYIQSSISTLTLFVAIIRIVPPEALWSRVPCDSSHQENCHDLVAPT